ncbi:DUF2291 family protein [Sodalis sp. RH19]|uniref:DUF2291 family protein n=1 Tax=Sodalis sp. RH19 TaxID=3394334 RepID=UPI0039B5BA17
MSTRMLWAVLVAVALSGCRIVSERQLAELKNPPNANVAKAAQLFDQKIAPQVIASARPLGSLLTQIGHATDFDAACQQFGYRSQEENPCVFAVSVTGAISEVNTTSRNGQIVIKSDDAAGEVNVQIGPTFRGTDLRDSYRGLSYADFNDQNLFGDFSKAINQQAINTVAKQTFAVGGKVTVYGVFSAFDTPQPPLLITPVKITQ